MKGLRGILLSQPRTVQMAMERNGERPWLYKGKYGDQNKIFITPTQLSIEQYLALTHDNVLKIDDLIKFQRDYLIAAEAIPVIPFFEELYSKYAERYEPRLRSMETWLGYCGGRLVTVVGDVFAGWKYLFENGFSCGGHMETLIFVDKNGRGLLLLRIQRTFYGGILNHSLKFWKRCFCCILTGNTIGLRKMILPSLKACKNFFHQRR